MTMTTTTPHEGTQRHEYFKNLRSFNTNYRLYCDILFGYVIYLSFIIELILVLITVYYNTIVNILGRIYHEMTKHFYINRVRCSSRLHHGYFPYLIIIINNPCFL